MQSGAALQLVVLGRFACAALGRPTEPAAVVGKPLGLVSQAAGERVCGGPHAALSSAAAPAW